MTAKATIFIHNHKDLEVLKPLFARIGVVVEDVKVDPNSELKPIERTEEEKMRFQEISKRILEKDHELLKRLAESERTDPKWNILLEELFATDKQMLQPILERFGLQHSIVEVCPNN